VMDTLMVRQLREAEAPQASAVLLAAYRQIYPEGDTSEEGYLHHVADVGARLSQVPVLGCFLGEQLIGSVTLVLDEASEYAEGLQVGEAGIRMLGVDPKAQRHGAGRALVTACLDRARADQKHAVALHTNVQMVQAQRLYERMGFVRVPERDLTLPQVKLLGYRRSLDG
jgi:ribosomal protein S18 acetylase RimI-like enzyme